MIRVAFILSVLAAVVPSALSNWVFRWVEERSHATAFANGQLVGWTEEGDRRGVIFDPGMIGYQVINPPPGFEKSSFSGTNGAQQVGFVSQGINTSRASLWSGTSESWVDLGPGYATCIDGPYQSGQGNGHASLWLGTAASRVDLHPRVGGTSWIAAMSDGEQVGTVHNPTNAYLWRGTAQSAVNLHPNWASRSWGTGTSRGQQVGYVEEIPTGRLQASLWTGSAASWRTLHPLWAVESIPYGVSQGRQAGVIGVNNLAGVMPGGACVWRGSVDTYENLDQYVDYPVGHSGGGSAALAIHVSDDGLVTVAGHVEYRAATWTRKYDVIPASAMTVQRGVVTSGNLASLLVSDDNKLAVRPGIVFSSAEWPVQIVFEATATSATPSAVDFVFETSGTSSSIEQKVELFDFQANEYVLRWNRNANSSDVYEVAAGIGSAARFVEPGTGKIRAKISAKATGPVFAYPWTVWIDRAVWMIPED